MNKLAAEALNSVDLQSSMEKSQAKWMQGVVRPLRSRGQLKKAKSVAVGTRMHSYAAAKFETEGLHGIFMSSLCSNENKTNCNWNCDCSTICP
jgi:hypothetical protein